MPIQALKSKILDSVYWAHPLNLTMLCILFTMYARLFAPDKVASYGTGRGAVLPLNICDEYILESPN